MAKSTKPKVSPEFGRGSGRPDPIDVHVGSRIRMRRLFLGMNQETLARELGLTFQQVQKYEGGANRVSASRLWEMAGVLGVPVSFFFDGLRSEETAANPEDEARRERLHRPESIELVRFYYAIQDLELRQRLLEMVKAAAHPGVSPS